MSETMWFNRQPGDTVAQGSEDPTALLIGDQTPDWVRLPPNLGGTRVKVTGSHTSPCPIKGHTSVRNLTLENGVSVAECSTHGFLWYRTPAK